MNGATWLQLNGANVSQRAAAVFSSASEAQEMPGGSADAREAQRRLLRPWLLSPNICCSLHFFSFCVGGAYHLHETFAWLCAACLDSIYEEEIKRAPFQQLTTAINGVCPLLNLKGRKKKTASLLRLKSLFFYFFNMRKDFWWFKKKKHLFFF